MMKMKHGRIWIRRLAAAAVLLITAFSASAAFAGEWGYDEARGWDYRKDDGSMAADEWLWINGYCYCFAPDGVLYTDTVTPDGYAVDSNGAWTVNGIIQREGFPTENARVVTPWFSYVAPEEWTGRYSGAYYIGNAVTFYDNANRRWGGQLFTVISRSEPAGADEFPDYGEIRYLGNYTDAYSGRTYYLYRAGTTDVPYDFGDPELRDGYWELQEAGTELIYSIRGPHGEFLQYQGKAYD